MRIKRDLPALLFSVLLVAGGTAAANAQANGGGNPNLRAANVARMRAEQLNGGLGVYRAASCMHEQAGGECLIEASNRGFLFRFYGGGPGWQQLGKPPTVETEILISPDGRSVLEVPYNGTPR